MGKREEGRANAKAKAKAKAKALTQRSRRLNGGSQRKATAKEKSAKGAKFGAKDAKEGEGEWDGSVDPTLRKGAKDGAPDSLWKFKGGPPAKMIPEFMFVLPKWNNEIQMIENSNQGSEVLGRESNVFALTRKENTPLMTISKFVHKTCRQPLPLLQPGLSVLVMLMFPIHAVTQAGLINTIAGNGTAGYSGDGGVATNAEMNTPYGIALDASGNLYIADSANNRIRKVTPSGQITTVAGNGNIGFSGDGGAATSASIWSPYFVAIASNGNLYISDHGNNRIRMINSQGVISTVAGDGSQTYSGDGGLAINAGISNPGSIAFDSNGNLYVTDTGTSRVREVAASTGIITTVAGNGLSGSTGDGGLATSAELSNPGGIALNGGNLYIAEGGNGANKGKIRVVNSSGIISTIAGVGVDGVTLNAAEDVKVDGCGNLFIADANNDRIVEITGLNLVGTVAGISGSAGFSGDGGQAAAAKLYGPVSVAIDSGGNLYISDRVNNRIRKVLN